MAARYRAVPLIGAVSAPLPLEIDRQEGEGEEGEKLESVDPSLVRFVARRRFLLPAWGEGTRRLHCYNCAYVIDFDSASIYTQKARFNEAPPGRSPEPRRRAI
ncbi:hypothetical protein B296_00058849, partial [Ensete ventricosum]